MKKITFLVAYLRLISSTNFSGHDSARKRTLFVEHQQNARWRPRELIVQRGMGKHIASPCNGRENSP